MQVSSSTTVSQPRLQPKLPACLLTRGKREQLTLEKEKTYREEMKKKEGRKEGRKEGKKTHFKLYHS